MAWLDSVAAIEEYEDVVLDARLVADLERAAAGSVPRPIRFSTPTFQGLCEHRAQGLLEEQLSVVLDHRRRVRAQLRPLPREILKPMLAATSPAMLDQKVRHLIATQDLQGFLLSGGSNRRNEIPYERFYPVVEQLKRISRT